MSVLAFGRKSNSLTWFASHEFRLIWRDFASMITAGKPSRIAIASFVIVCFAAGMHWFVAHLMQETLKNGIVIDKAALVMITGFVAMLFSLMFSQAIESVTRAYYARSDLDLILSSPATVKRLFQVRTSILTLQTIVFSMLIASPMINVLAYKDGVHWLSAYIVLIALGGVATGIAVLLTLALFKTVGPARTRLIAQIIAAIVGAGFIISLQAVAILFGEGISRFSFFTAESTVTSAPEVASWVWLPAQAVMGDGPSLLLMVALSGLFLFLVVSHSTRRFASDALATSGLVERKSQAGSFTGFRSKSSLRSNLRRKEWKLLKRDPWLLSQSLQQILYLIAPGLLLWVNYGQQSGLYYVIIPVVVMAAGQLAGGLSWVTISGEDAHELIDTAPVSQRTILLAKVEAVIVLVGLAVSPFLIALGLFSIRAAVCLAVDTLLATFCAVLIQIWFRSQANRSLFRRRQVSSKAATLCEAFVSILWAAGAALAFYHWLLIIPFALLVLIIMAIAWFIRPRAGV